jgi:hypothetical protein
LAEKEALSFQQSAISEKPQDGCSHDHMVGQGMSADFLLLTADG